MIQLVTIVLYYFAPPLLRNRVRAIAKLQTAECAQIPVLRLRPEVDIAQTA
ncbi:hypothetical protein H6F90_24915 [Trichocoleus sp. FACHB-591]|uniref:hypothetical protein n=1 Tax=Trichocoleus sp. FACHB-591 TaxID=2692872 RepID=UPI001685DF33|nr:hypothetical protein [Trichocoleus sp. FACHB-591]MBD2098316.1 hypothetical protein [Trichocoleus sp. FACHB-591]